MTDGGDGQGEVRWRAARENLERAERRGAPDDELQRIEDAVIAARVSMMRAAMRQGLPVTEAERELLERDSELLRRFPSDRAGDGGVGWFDWPLRA
jgi:hypothetical protein